MGDHGNGHTHIGMCAGYPRRSPVRYRQTSCLWYTDAPEKLDPRAGTECIVTGNDFVCSFTNAVPASWINSVSVYAIPREKEYGGSNYGRDDKRGRGVTIEF